MTMTDGKKVWAKGISFGMDAGTVNVPYPLLAHYRDLHLSDTEAMFLIQLLTFRQVEHNEFPSIEQLEERMDSAPGALSPVIRRLLKEGWISIDEIKDESTGIQSESYNLSGMYSRLGQYLAELEITARQNEAVREVETVQQEERERNLFVIFEKEFGRPLSPMECETISVWMDQDKYPEELIRLALKEAVFAGKVHFRYINRILFEWSRNRIKTADDAKAYTQRFRSGMR